jgi:GT2 family glycosyltransferase
VTTVEPNADRTHAPSASVVICTYSTDRWDDFRAAVRSVLDQVDDPADVVLVVDHNVALAEAVRVEFPECTTAPNRYGPGLSGARNTGVLAARHGLVLFLDDDAVAAPGWLGAHVRAYGDAGVVGTAGLVLPAWDGGGPPPWWPTPFDWVVGCNDQRVAPSGEAVRNPTGANMGFRRAEILRAGGFSDRLGRTSAQAAGCEETELAIRITQRSPGSRIVSVPDAVCRHRVPEARVTWRYFRARCLAEGRSKAVVSRLTGLEAATGTERGYAAKTLPVAVATAVRRRKLRRAMAIVAGLCFAAAGFLPALFDDGETNEDRFARSALVERKATD